MKALLLAGGLGTRLQPLTDDLPKPMVPVGNRPWLEHLVRHYKSQGIREFVLAVHYQRERIERHFGDGAKFGVHMEYATEQEGLGTAGAVKNAAPLLDGRFLAVNADIVHPIDLAPVLQFHEDRGGAVTVCLTEVDDPAHYGAVERAEDGRITKFIEKPKNTEVPSKWINAGIYIMERRVLERIPSGKAVSLEKEVFPQLIAEGAGIYGYPTEGYWLDMGTLARYRQAHRDLLDRKFTVAMEDADSSEPGVLLGRNVRIGKHVRFVPPVMIGEEVAIDSGSVIGPYTVIGNGCRIGSRVRASGSILWDRCALADGAQVSDCIFGSGVKVGPRNLHEAVIIRNQEVRRR